MENIFEKGSRITTNKLNCFEVVDANKYQVVCRDLLTGDFNIFDKTEHKFEVVDVKIILKNSLIEILDDSGISTKSKEFIFSNMRVRISNWL